MAMDEDIRGTVQKLETRISSLQKARDILVQEYGGEEQEPVGPIPATETPVTSNAGATRVPRGSQKPRLVAFLKHYGPAYRRQILSETEIPTGTIWSGPQN